jgi:hypothetical protein
MSGCFRLIDYFFNFRSSDAARHTPRRDIAFAATEKRHADGRENRNLLLAAVGILRIGNGDLDLTAVSMPDKTAAGTLLSDLDP